MSFSSDKSFRNERNVKDAKKLNFTFNSTSKFDGNSDFSQWVTAMTMVAQLPEGTPGEFRKKLWLTLANKHLEDKGVDWTRVERHCLSCEGSRDAEEELDAQIVKDLHRTGYSMFRGKEGQKNQVLLKQVLLAYARWNKAVGYCQGFNMLAGLFLQVTDRDPSDTLKLMIYLIEGVLPESYFADNLLGLSVDMAVFRELLKIKLPRLSKHLNHLQNCSKEGITSYEPPLTNVFTMQWFLTLFCNCLPQHSVLRVWDLILLEGNEILLKTALAIWQILSEKILKATSADDFYSLMGILTQQMLENNIIEVNTIIRSVITIGPLKELKGLREYYFFHINPRSPVPKNLQIDKNLKVYPKQNLILDLGVLKRQYVKLRQRQRQAHIIFSTAVNRQKEAPVAINHLMLGKTLSKPLEPPKTNSKIQANTESLSSSSSDTELCDDKIQSDSDEEIAPLPLDDVSCNKVHSQLDFLDTELDKIKSLQDRLENLKTKPNNLIEISSENSFCDTDLDKKSINEKSSSKVSQIIEENNLVLHRILQSHQKGSQDLDETSLSYKCSDSVSNSSLDQLSLNPVDLLLLDSTKLDDSLDDYGEFQSGLDFFIKKDVDTDDFLIKDNTGCNPNLLNKTDDNLSKSSNSQFNESLIEKSSIFCNTIFNEDKLNSKTEPLVKNNSDLYNTPEKNILLINNSIEEHSFNTELLSSEEFYNKPEDVTDNSLKSDFNILDEYPFVKDLLRNQKSYEHDDHSFDFPSSEKNLENELTECSNPNSGQRQSSPDLSSKISVSECPIGMLSEDTSSCIKTDVFNPFPTQIGTRQTKEIPLRLGLYKT